MEDKDLLINIMNIEVPSKSKMNRVGKKLRNDCLDEDTLNSISK